MGVPVGGSVDLAVKLLLGTLSSAIASQSAQFFGAFNMALWGTFVGTVVLERSIDGGTTWVPVTFPNGTTVTFTAPISVSWQEPVPGVSHRLRCSAYTSGTINFRLSQ